MTFKVGDRVKVTNASPPGHVRTPTFVRGKTGTIIRHYGAFPNPERLAYGMTGLPTSLPAFKAVPEPSGLALLIIAAGSPLAVFLPNDLATLTNSTQ